MAALSTFVFALVLLQLSNFVSAQKTAAQLQAELKGWNVEDSHGLDEVYAECALRARCIGLPDGCLDRQNCHVFAHIISPGRTPRTTVRYRMFIDLGPAQMNLDAKHWIAIGLNKNGPQMGSASVSICYFGDLNGKEYDGTYAGWTVEHSGVVPVFENKTLFDKERIRQSKNLSLSAARRTNYKKSTFAVSTIGEAVLQRSKGGSLYKCAFRRREIGGIYFDHTKYKLLAEAAFNRETIFNLRADNYWMLLATGELELGLEKDGSVTPNFKGHERKDATASDRLKIGVGVCESYAVCLGRGFDGCEHTTSDGCDMFFSIERTVNNTRVVMSPIMTMTISLRSNANYEGYVALAISNTSNVDQTHLIPRISSLIVCSKSALTMYTATGCKNTSSVLQCDTVKLTDADLQTHAWIANEIEAQAKEEMTLGCHADFRGPSFFTNYNDRQVLFILFTSSKPLNSTDPMKGKISIPHSPDTSLLIRKATTIYGTVSSKRIVQAADFTIPEPKMTGRARTPPPPGSLGLDANRAVVGANVNSCEIVGLLSVVLLLVI